MSLPILPPPTPPHCWCSALLLLLTCSSPCPAVPSSSHYAFHLPVLVYESLPLPGTPISTELSTGELSMLVNTSWGVTRSTNCSTKIYQVLHARHWARPCVNQEEGVLDAPCVILTPHFNEKLLVVSAMPFRAGSAPVSTKYLQVKILTHPPLTLSLILKISKFSIFPTRPHKKIFVTE